MKKVTNLGHGSPPPFLATRTRAPYVKAASLAGFTDLVAAAGGDATDLASLVGIPEDALTDPDMVISWNALGDLMELAADMFGKPSLGLEWVMSEPAPLLSFGPIALLTRFSSTIGEWCRLSISYSKVHTNALRVHLEESECGQLMVLRLVFHEVVPPSRHQTDYILGGICTLARTLTAVSDDSFHIVRFQSLQPDDISLYAKVFPCPVEFGCAHDELVYRREVDDLAIDQQTGPLTELFAQYLRSRLGGNTDCATSIRAAAEVAIKNLVGTGFSTLPHVAALLSISPKTLQRRLANEETTFAGLLDQCREKLARRYLQDSDIPVTSVAGMLGYTKAPHFTSAFRRWTGVSPRAFRNALRPDGEPLRQVSPARS